jgi:MarR family 2-MHQ and catechol resistance regulon transcriptional repressor
MQKNDREIQDTSGVHVWLVLWKAFRALSTHAEKSLTRTGLGSSDFRVLEVLLHKGPLPVNTIGPKVGLTPGSISVAIDRLVKKTLVSRENDDEDRRLRIVRLTPKGRTLISKIFDEHAAAMEEATRALSRDERVTLIGLLRKLGKAAQPD